MEQMQIKATLEQAGVDYDKGLERFMGNVALYHKFLLKFLVDGSYADFVKELAAGDLVLAEKSVKRRTQRCRQSEPDRAARRSKSWRKKSAKAMRKPVRLSVSASANDQKTKSLLPSRRRLFVLARFL